MSKALAILVALALLVWSLVIAYDRIREGSQWQADTTTLFTAIELERVVREREQVWRDSVEGVTDSLLGVADRHSARGMRYLATADSLKALLQTATSPTDSLGFALQRIENLGGSLGEAQAQTASLRAILGAQAMVLARLRASEQRAWHLIDSASAVIRRVPGPCRVPVVGIKCPVFGVGVVGTLHGVQPGVAVILPL